MPITVRFSRRGCYLPAFGRLGMGENAGRIYELHDLYAAPGMLPKDAEILDGLDDEAFEELLEDVDQDRPFRPRADKDELERAAAQAKNKSASAKKKKAAAKPKPQPEPTAEELDEEPVVAEAPQEEERPARRRRSRRAAG